MALGDISMPIPDDWRFSAEHAAPDLFSIPPSNYCLDQDRKVRHSVLDE